MAAALAEKRWDLVICDYNLPGFSGADALQLLREHSRDIPLIMVSGCIGEEAAVTMMKAGADDYVMKDNLARLAPAVERSLKEARTRAQRQLAQNALRESEARFKAIASNTPGMVLQLLLHPDGNWSFSYLSDGCLLLCSAIRACFSTSSHPRIRPHSRNRCGPRRRISPSGTGRAASVSAAAPKQNG
jgi:PAS domain-containing protein